MRLSFYALLASVFVLTACGSTPAPSPKEGPGFMHGKPVHPTVKLGKPYTVRGETYVPKYDPTYSEEGEASWYGPGFHGRSTANGERFDKYALTAAHRTLPLPSMVRVTNMNNGRSVVVRINDRGPFADDRIIDLSKRAAEEIDMIRTGTAHVKVEYLERETRAYLAQLGGGNHESVSDLARDAYNTPQPVNVASTAPVRTTGDVNVKKDSGSWWDNIVPSAQASEPKRATHETHDAASVTSIASNELAPPAGANPNLPARLPHPASPDYKPANVPVTEAKAAAPTYSQSSFSVLDKPASDTQVSSQAPPSSGTPPTQAIKTAPPAGAPMASRTSVAPSASPAASVATPSRQPPTPAPSKLGIQVGAFNSRANAEKLSEQFKELAPVMIQGVPENAPSIFRVRLGPFDDRYSAENVLSQVREKGAPDAQFIQY